MEELATAEEYYKSTSVWKVIREIFASGKACDRVRLAIVFLLIALATVSFWKAGILKGMPIMVLSFWIFYIEFSERKKSLYEKYSAYKSQIRRYRLGFQYIRYLRFKDLWVSGEGANLEKINKVLFYINVEIGTTSSAASIVSHPKVSVPLAVLISIIVNGLTVKITEATLFVFMLSKQV